MKRTLFLFLALLLLWSTSCAADAPAEYFNYEYNSDFDGIVITEYIGPDVLQDLIIPSKINGKSVVSIGTSAFAQRTGLVGQLYIPDSVKRIEGSAFIGCSGFTGALTIGKNVKEIGVSAFKGCSGFTQLKLNHGLKRIGRSAFYNCSGFGGDLIIPDSVTVICEYAFFNCSGLDGNVTFGKHLKGIGHYAFGQCSKLSGTIEFPQGLQYILDGAFFGCSSLQEMVIPASVQFIGDAAFGWGNQAQIITEDNTLELGRAKKKFPNEEEQYGIRQKTEDGFEYVVSDDEVVIVGYQGGVSESFIIPSSIDGKPVVRIGERAFAERSDITGNLVLPDTLRVISQSAFDRCSGLSGKLVIPDHVQIIEDGAFLYCSGFNNELVLGESVLFIGQSAFSECGLIGRILLPDSLVEIENNAFSRNDFSSISEEGDGPEFIAQYAFYKCNNMEGTLFDYPERYIGKPAFESRVVIQKTSNMLRQSIENPPVSDHSDIGNETDEATPRKHTAVVATKSNPLTLRQTPGNNGQKILFINKGETVTVLQDGDWPLIEYNGHQGYVNGQYLK